MHIAKPCHEDWNRMSPNDQGRHCAVCDKTVVDLTPLDTSARRERLAGISQELRQGKRVCVRGRVDRDGALAGSRRTLTGGMALLLAVTFAGCTGEGPQVAAEEPGQQTTVTAPPKIDPQAPVAGGVREAVPPMGIMAPPETPVTGSPVPQVPVPEARILRGDVAEPLPTKMGEMVCPVPPPPAPEPAPLPVIMGKVAAPAR